MECNIAKERLLEQVADTHHNIDGDLQGHIIICQSCRSYYETVSMICDNYKKKVELTNINIKRDMLVNKILYEKRADVFSILKIAASIIIILLIGLFIMTNVRTGPGINQEQQSISTVYYSEDLDVLTELPGDLYLSAGFEDMSDKEFALLLYDLNASFFNMGD